MLVQDPPHKEVNPTKGGQTKWEKEKKVHLDIVEDLQKIQKFEGRPIEVKALHIDLEPTKLFIQTKGLNGKMPLGMMKRKSIYQVVAKGQLN